MSDADLIQRLSSLPHMGEIPFEELEWLIEHGTLEVHPAGYVLGPMGELVVKLFVVISGIVAVRVDSGAGPKLVAEWHAGEVTGMLPYSRMKGPPGDNYCAEDSEFLSVGVEHFPEMAHQCPAFTAYTVHIMLDRARNFNTSALLDEKMVSLGKLSAGLAHELNNPASAMKRGADLLSRDLSQLDDASRAMSNQTITDQMFQAIDAVTPLSLTQPDQTKETMFARQEREDRLAGWLTAHSADPAHASALSDTAVTVEALDSLAEVMPAPVLDSVLRWFAARGETQLLANELAEAANRIYELVAAVKKFTYMDNLAAADFVHVETGLRETVRVLDSKVRTTGATIRVNTVPDLPTVRGTGSELNQVWFNLIDNALDAIEESGQIEVTVCQELDHIVIRVTDNGPGIDEQELERVFDPFYTTKPPGQGTGLGLDMSRRLIRRYRGDLHAKSRPGKTEFRVSLPVEEEPPKKV
jgi:signal transduction histidine kinase